MECKRCGNKDIRYFYQGSKGWYCRKCIRFKDQLIVEEESREVDSEYHLKFPLTPQQLLASEQLNEYVKSGQSVLLNAICGAGKTELIMQTISYQLSIGKKVGIAIPRRQVVLEIAQRMAESFEHLKVVAVCQGHNDETMGDLIVCTTHQLYRYQQYFDVLIIDEPDGFPFKGDEVLHGIARCAVKGPTVYLTATPDRELLSQVDEGKLKEVVLFRRPHFHDLCVPEVFYGFETILVIRMWMWLIHEHRNRKQVILFVPTRKLCETFYRMLKGFFRCCRMNSASQDRDQLIQDFKKGKYEICISTTVLERGITIPAIDICVYRADHGVFDKASLTQMSGRVGRSMNCPDGNCLFLCGRRIETVDECIADIERANRYGTAVLPDLS